MCTQSQSAGALVGVVVAALAGCGGRAAAEADRVCTPLPAAAANQSTFPAPWPAQMASFAWGADHALYALGQWLQDGGVRRTLLRSTDLGASFCVLPAPEPLDQLAAADGSPIMFGITGRRGDDHSFRVVRSLDAGTSWHQIGGELPVDSGPYTLAGVGSRGFTAWISDVNGTYWVTRDAGVHFQSTPLALPTTPDSNTFLESFLVDPELPGRAFAHYLRLTGNIASTPLYRTDDDGVSWRAVTPPEPLPAFASGMALTRGSRLVWVGMNRLWLSDNGGQTWQGGIYIPADTRLYQSGQVLALIDHRTTGRVSYRFSNDGGEKWYPTSAFAGNQAAGELVADAASGTMLASTRLGLFRSRDNAHWESVHVSPHSASEIVFAGWRAMWAAAANAILTSRDRGATWSVARFVDGDVALSVDPSNGNRGLAIVTQPLAASSEVPAPRLLRTLDGGASWQDVATPTGNAATAPGWRATIAADGTIYVSTYANGAYGIAASHDGGASFVAGAARPPATAAALVAMAADPGDARRVWLEVDGGLLHETRDAGGSWQTHAVARPSPASQTQTPPTRSAGIVFSAGAIVIAGPRGPARSTDGGITWTIPALPGPQILADGAPDILALRAAPDGRLLMASYNRLFASSDAGATWTVAVELPLWSSLGAPVFDPARPDRVLLPFTTAATIPYLTADAVPSYPLGVLPWELWSLIEVSLP